MAFGITMSQFFAEGNLVELTEEQQTLLDKWVMLTPAQKQAVLQIIETYAK